MKWTVQENVTDGFVRIVREDGTLVATFGFAGEAKLAAAAPELLEALRGAALFIQGQLSPEGRMKALEKIDAAINKAELGGK